MQCAKARVTHWAFREVLFYKRDKGDKKHMGSLS